MHGTLALSLLSLFVLLGLVGRIAIQRRHTGESGLRIFTASRLSLPWLADLFMMLATILCVLAVVAAAFGSSAPLFLSLPASGMTLALLGTVGCFGSQLWMGSSWRIGVRSGERTPLVDEGPFGVVRNPIFTSVLVFLLGITLLVPTPLMVFGLALAVVGIEVQVRLVEEPHLARVHGERYRAYAARVGRFMPRIQREGPSADLEASIKRPHALRGGEGGAPGGR